LLFWLKCPLQETKTNKNRGRRNHGCPKYKIGESCGFFTWVDAKISPSTRNVSKTFHRSNVEEKLSSHTEDDGNSMDAEFIVFKAQLKHFEQDVLKLKKQNSALKTMLIVSWMFRKLVISKYEDE